MVDSSRLPDLHLQAAKRRLVHLAGLQAKTNTAEQTILDAASARLDAVNKQITTLQPKALTDAAAGDQYQALVLERGQLQTVIANAQQKLGA